MNALTVTQPPSAPAFTMTDMERVALAIAKGGLFGSTDPNAVLTLCMLAQAEGQHPAVVFRDYHIIKGQPAKKAEAMLRDFITAGGKVEWHALTDTLADATFSHPFGGTVRLEWDHKRAIQAQLGNNPMYKKYPRQMLRSRCISEGVRTVCPSATSGLYEVGEVQDIAAERSAPEHAMIEHDAQPSQRSGPEPRTKLEGTYTSKGALRKAIVEARNKVRAAETVEGVDGVLREYKDAIKQAQRDWPELIDGEPNLEEDIGLKGDAANRRAALSAPATPTMFDMLVASMRECTTPLALGEWREINWELIEALDDAENRAFQKEFEAFDAGLVLVDRATAGA